MWGFLVVLFFLIQIYNYSCCKTLLFKDVLKSPVSFSLSLLKKRKMKALNHKNTQVYINSDTFLLKCTLFSGSLSKLTHISLAQGSIFIFWDWRAAGLACWHVSGQLKTLKNSTNQPTNKRWHTPKEQRTRNTAKFVHSHTYTFTYIHIYIQREGGTCMHIPTQKINTK